MKKSLFVLAAALFIAGCQTAAPIEEKKLSEPAVNKESTDVKVHEVSLDAKIVSQSSVSKWESYVTHDLFSHKGYGVAFQTDVESNPYIIIALKKPEILTKVIIKNREDATYHDTAKKLVMWLSEDKKNWRKVWSADGNVEVVWVVELKKEKAQYIKLSLDDKNELALAKIHVYGVDAK